jgi:UDP-N-acetylglucosamine 1-carboxyvinyltransferase
MDRIRIRGGRQLKGEIRISGSKNASLPLMVAALLSDKKLVLHNVPRLADITTMVQLLKQHGVEIGAAPGENGHARGTTLTLQAAKISSTTAPYDIVRKMRASVLVLGALLAREGVARVSLPGGCAIGARPVDLHIAGLKAMGAQIDIDGGYLVAKAPKGLKGARFTFPKVSVGATENLMMAAALAKGTTVLANAAREPEIIDLAECLAKMGVPITGIGTETSSGCRDAEEGPHGVIPDRIRPAPAAMAVAMTAGDVSTGGRPIDETAAPACARRASAWKDRSRPARAADQRRPARRRRVTEPIGFPTDLQAQMMALMTRSEGASMITETVFQPFHARAGTLAHGRQRHHPSRMALVRGVPQAARRRGDGDRSARLGVACHCRARRRRRHHGEPRLSPRPRLRAAGRETRRLWCRHRAAEEVMAPLLWPMLRDARCARSSA